MRWEVWVRPPSPVARLLVIASAVAMAAIAVVSMSNLLLALFGAVAILGSALELFFPIRYELNGGGAKAKCGFTSQEIGWGQVRRVEVGEQCVLLSPFSQASRLDRFRGVRLVCRGNLDSVLAKISALRGNDEGTVEGTSDE